METPDHSWTPDAERREDPTSHSDPSQWLGSSDEPPTHVADRNSPTEPLVHQRSRAAFSPPPWPLARPSENQVFQWNGFTALLAITAVVFAVILMLVFVVDLELRGAAAGYAGGHSLPHTAVPTTSPTATVPATLASATFTSTDMSTQGNWQGVYGTTGYLLAGDAQQVPSTLQVTMSGQSGFVWAASSADSRALQKASTPGDSIAACWYASTSFTIDIDLTDGQAHQVALYLLDWDQLNRVENVTVLDAASGVVLDTRSISGFGNGEYLVWQIRGHVVVQVTNALGSPNAVVSGLFIS